MATSHFVSVTEIILGSATLAIFFYASFWVFKIVQFRSLFILSLMVLSCLSMLLSVVVLTVELVRPNGSNLYLKLVQLGCFALTLEINTRLWLNHLFKIEEQIRKSEFRKTHRMLDYGFLALISVQICFVFYVFTACE